MIIETKYNIGDTAWYSDNGEIFEDVITQIELNTITSNEQPIIYYRFKCKRRGTKPYDFYAVLAQECRLYKTKQALLDSL